MSVLASGQKSSFSWREETTFGTLAVGEYRQRPVNTESLDESINTLTGEDLRSDRATPSVRGGNISTGGGFTHDFGLIQTIPMLRHLLASGATGTAGTSYTIATVAASAFKRGDFVKSTTHVFACVHGGTPAATPLTAFDAVTTTGRRIVSGTSTWECRGTIAGVGSMYTHTLTAATDFPTGGLSFEKAIKGAAAIKYLQWTGGRLNSLDLTIPQEGIVKSNWGALFTRSYEPVSPADATPTMSTDTPVTGQQSFIHLSDTLTGAEANIGVFKEASLTINNGIQEDTFVVGSRYRQELPEGRRSLSGRISCYFKDATLYTAFKAESIITLGFSFLHENAFMSIEIPEVKLTGSGSPKITGPGLLMQDFEFTGFKQDSAYDIKVIARSQNQNVDVWA